MPVLALPLPVTSRTRTFIHHYFGGRKDEKYIFWSVYVVNKMTRYRRTEVAEKLAHEIAT
jgi:hypothetical protein